jgi:hypothetical protein
MTTIHTPLAQALAEAQPAKNRRPPGRKTKPAAGDLQYGRSRVTNHKDLLPNLDGRSKSARRYRDLVHSYLAEMGGEDNCSETQIGYLRRLCAIIVQSELLEARMVNGEDVDVSILCTLASTTVRLSQRLGISNAIKKSEPSFSDIFAAAKQSEDAAA